MITRRRMLVEVNEALELIEMVQADVASFQDRVDAILERLAPNPGDVVLLIWYLSALAEHHLSAGGDLERELRRLRLDAMDQASAFAP